jgi:hypothetical protein
LFTKQAEEAFSSHKRAPNALLIGDISLESRKHIPDQTHDATANVSKQVKKRRNGEVDANAGADAREMSVMSHK